MFNFVFYNCSLYRLTVIVKIHLNTLLRTLKAKNSIYLLKLIKLEIFKLFNNQYVVN